MPMINIEDAYILDETGAQVDKVTGLFTKDESTTSGEKAQARYNIGAGGSNDNLLDNAYFVGGGSQLGDGVFPINQRGLTSYTGGIFLDRWTTDNGLTLASDGITVSTGALYQNNWAPLTKVLLGKTLTASVLFADGTIESGTTTWPTTIPSELTFLYYPNANIQLLTVFFTDGTTQLFRTVPTGRKIAAVKLELGTVSTLANDVPPDFGEELAKCQRYLYSVAFPAYSYTGQVAYALDGSSINWNVVTPVPMRGNVIPQVSVTGTLYAGGAVISNMQSVTYPYGNNVKISAAASGLTGGQLYGITTSASEVRLLISCEL